MPLSRRTLIRISTVAIAAAALGSPAGEALPAAAAPRQATWCSCVVYVQNVLGRNTGVRHARELGDWLKRNGWREQRTPTVGAIVVMQPSFPGADRVSGHAGFVARVTSRKNRHATLYKIAVRGANQGGRETEAGCTNVNTVDFGAEFDQDDSRIRFYVRVR